MSRLHRLIAHLPADSAYRRATSQPWSESLELEATQVELLHALLIGLARLGGSRKQMKPLHVPRPDEPVRVPRRSSFLDLIGEPEHGHDG